MSTKMPPAKRFSDSVMPLSPPLPPAWRRIFLHTFRRRAKLPSARQLPLPAPGLQNRARERRGEFVLCIGLLKLLSYLIQGGLSLSSVNLPKKAVAAEEFSSQIGSSRSEEHTSELQSLR